MLRESVADSTKYLGAENEHIPGLVTHWFGNYGLQDLVDAAHVLRLAANRLRSQVRPCTSRLQTVEKLMSATQCKIFYPIPKPKMSNTLAGKWRCRVN